MNADASKLLVLVTSLSCPFAQLVRADTTVSIGSTTGAPGTVVSVPIQVVSDANVVAAQFELVYDPTKLGAVSASDSSALVDHSVKSSEPRAGVRRVVIYSLSNAAFQNGA